ncbi:MAG TPA: RdgB/HAM1 family non-canonical purine NTP pyrophosphatase [Myxococcota bacterium]|nr:RdgB/HAM1 family non-canonical purine NTP pyrophosphatase [Myxococcota bacterium]
MKRLLLATRNEAKQRELRALLAVPNLVLETFAQHPLIGDLEEVGVTFEANARAKALHAARASGLLALGEDSGLEVDALGGAPGVWSARYSGTHGDDAANIAKLLHELERADDRRARFVCTVAVAEPDGEVTATARGACEGAIALAPRGAGGFGYDPIFLPDAALGRTMAELNPDEKSALSHRAQALRRIVPFLRSIL